MKGGVLYMKIIKQLEAFDINPNHIINRKFVFNNIQENDYEWMEKQMEYINNLSPRDKHIIRAYTIYGDRFVNNYIRGTLSSEQIAILVYECRKTDENPFQYQHQDKYNLLGFPDKESDILEYIPKFIDELKTIIINSPKLNKRIKVFRGLGDGEFIRRALEEHNNKYILNNEFISTTFYLASASQFMKGDCCLLELFIEKEVPCLFTAHISRRRNEFEITLIPETKMIYRKCTKKYLIDEMESYENLNVFFKPEKYGARIIRMCEFDVGMQ
jgi:hypothetical protein